MLEEEVKQEMLEQNNLKLSKKADKYGLVLVGGGGKGAYQVGAFEALKERGFADRICGMSGCSVGSLNLALFAMNDVDMAITSAKDAWSHITNSQFMSIDYDLIDFKEGLLSRDGLLKIMDDYVNFDEISQSERPLYVNATQIIGEEKIPRYFKLNDRCKEDIVTLLAASSALPIAYENVEFEGMRLKDGGVVDNIPIKPLYDEGIRDFIILDLTENPDNFNKKYPDCNFIHIAPLYSLGDLITGTLDFSANGAKFRMELGYIDTIRLLDKMFDGKYISMDAYEVAARTDYDRAKLSLNVMNSHTKLQSEIDKLHI